jgi:hypothetical protein
MVIWNRYILIGVCLRKLVINGDFIVKYCLGEFLSHLLKNRTNEFVAK